MSSLQQPARGSAHPGRDEALVNCRSALLARLSGEGHWIGQLSSSALSTAVAVAALSELGSEPQLVENGLGWLARHQNADGGWGDTPESPSNLSTTLLSWAAFYHHPDRARQHESVVQRSEAFILKELGSLAPGEIAGRVLAHYGKDRTFSVPILTLCAICGRLGKSEDAWNHIPQLPFELAALPHRVFRWIQLPVVSYAMPALIAIGLARHEHTSRHATPLRWLRERLKPSVLRVLHSMQPETGGYLEAIPLTGFVTLSLAASGLDQHLVARAGARFLCNSVRPDGSWPIDVNLNTWLTSLSVHALALDGSPEWKSKNHGAIVRWFLNQQHQREHPFTHAAPGGWAWTDLAGGVPDADDTAGALVALHHLAPQSPEARMAATAGVHWLLDLQNRDGGIPTFCRGWLNLPFDCSCPDVTAHALAAWDLWRTEMPAGLQERLQSASAKAWRYLEKVQHADGTWHPLWFGSQFSPDHSNPLYGTARVLSAASGFVLNDSHAAEAVSKAQQWLLSAQHSNGGWGAVPGVAPTIEETALAIDALCASRSADQMAIDKGVQWLIDATRNGTHFPASAIGLYFSKLWYSEELYPIVFTHTALSRARNRQRVPIQD